MANEQNLIPQNKRTKSEQREIAKLGGKKSVASRRKKKYIKEQLEQLMLIDLPKGKLQENMKKLGIEESEISIQNAMCVALIQQALNGSIRAFKVIGEYLGQDPKNGVDKERIENLYFINDIPKITTKAELEAELEKWNPKK